jgi:hypothetical protein
MALWGPWLFMVFSEGWQPVDACRQMAIILLHGGAIAAICIAVVRAGMEPAEEGVWQPGIWRVELWVRQSQRRTGQ